MSKVDWEEIPILKVVCRRRASSSAKTAFPLEARDASGIRTIRGVETIGVGITKTRTDTITRTKTKFATIGWIKVSLAGVGTSLVVVRVT